MIVTAVIELISLLSGNSGGQFRGISPGLSFTALGIAGAQDNPLGSAAQPFAEISFVASKVIPLTSSIAINRAGVKQVILTGLREDTILTKVVVFLTGGESLRLYALEGRLKPGGKKFSDFNDKNGTRIDRIEIGSLTPRIIGPRGGVSVALTEVPTPR
jgi:hypothetical protein